MRNFATVMMVGFWGCNAASKVKTEEAIKTFFRNPSLDQSYKACKVLIERATAEETGQVYAEVMDRMMTEGTAPKTVSKGMTASEYQALSPEEVNKHMRQFYQAGVDLRMDCREIIYEIESRV